MDHAPNRRKRCSVGRWYSFVKMQGRVASRLPRIVVVSENSIRDIHDDMGVDYDRMRLVPVGVDPELFRPRPDDRPRARPADHDGVGRRRPQGPVLPARGDGQAAHRARRLADDHRQAEGRQEHGPDPLARPRSTTSDFVSGVTDERIVELYAEAELAVVPSLYEGFSLPAIEAMVTGTALVATDGGALPEVTGRDGETVLSCRAGDAERWPRRSPAASTTPSCGPASARPGASGSSSAGRGGAAPS